MSIFRSPSNISGQSQTIRKKRDVNFSPIICRRFENVKNDEKQIPLRIRRYRGTIKDFRLKPETLEMWLTVRFGLIGLLFLLAGAVGTHFAFWPVLILIFWGMAGIHLLLALICAIGWFSVRSKFGCFCELDRFSLSRDEPTEALLCFRGKETLDEVRAYLECYGRIVRSERHESYEDGLEKLWYRRAVNTTDKVSSKKGYYSVALSLQPTQFATFHSFQRRIFWYLIVEARHCDKVYKWTIQLPVE